VNLLIALVLFWVVLVSGNLNGATTLANLNPSIATLRTTTSVGTVIEKTPAVGLLKVGDRLISVDGHPATVNGIRDVVGDDVCAGQLVAGCRAREPVNVQLRRANRLLDISVYPQYYGPEKRMLIGFSFGATAKHYGPIAAVVVVGREVGKTAASIVSGLGKALTSTRERSHIRSILGITEVAHEGVARGWGFGLVIFGFVSLALALINLFPFLPLDGGHVLWAVAEKVRGHRIPMAAMVRFSSVGMVLLLFLVFNGFYNDLTRLGA
jgi:regulator of sigma E protease